MKKYIKSLLFVAGAVVLAIVGLVLKGTDYSGYSVLCFTIGVILLLLGIASALTSHDPNKLYESKIKNILNTYDSILVKSNKIPSLEGRNVVNVEKMEDLVDAQLELRKPICYLKQSESCSFVLLDEKEAFVYVEKLNDDVVSPVEIELNELRLKEKDKDDMDSEMLKGIDKTTVVKLSNRKSYKVSPIRKKKEDEQGEQPAEENKEVVEEKHEEAPKFDVVEKEEVKQEVVETTPEEKEEVAEEVKEEIKKESKVKEDPEVI